LTFLYITHDDDDDDDDDFDDDEDEDEDVDELYYLFVVRSWFI
jgi:hypothetical protein